MARQGARPLHIYKETTRLLQSGILRKEPPWYSVVGAIPPSTILIRTPPVKFESSQEKREAGPIHTKSRGVKKSQQFLKPGHVHYPEDDLRRIFFSDHPWELARPRIIVENFGNDCLAYDWSRIQQPGRELNGESVVQRQLWLMENKSLSQQDAYEVARNEFYRLRMRADIEQRIAIEEARSVGAYFCKTHLQIGLELEARSLSTWKGKAQNEVVRRKQRIDAVAGAGNIDDSGSIEGAGTSASILPAPTAEHGQTIAATPDITIS